VRFGLESRNFLALMIDNGTRFEPSSAPGKDLTGVLPREANARVASSKRAAARGRIRYWRRLTRNCPTAAFAPRSHVLGHRRTAITAMLHMKHDDPCFERH
jgi:hypothetical protein